MGHDYQPYRCAGATSSPTTAPARWGDGDPVVELPFSWTLDDYVYLEFVTFRRMMMPGLRRPEDMFANFTGDVRWMTREVGHGVCNVVFHPQVIGRGHRLLAFEALARRARRARRQLRPHGRRRRRLRRRAPRSASRTDSVSGCAKGPGRPFRAADRRRENDLRPGDGG